jgi:hypothetical protein
MIVSDDNLATCSEQMAPQPPLPLERVFQRLWLCRDVSGSELLAILGRMDVVFLEAINTIIKKTIAPVVNNSLQN